MPIDEEDLPPATIVYFGGGTPSRLPVDWLLAVLDAIPRSEDAEVTVECNPEDAAPAAARRLPARSGSPGCRSGPVDGRRTCSPDSAGATARREGLDGALAVGEAGFASVNADLIFGGAGERDEDWERSLGAVLDLESPPPHVSAYALTVEPATPLAR